MKRFFRNCLQTGLTSMLACTTVLSAYDLRKNLHLNTESVKFLHGDFMISVPHADKIQFQINMKQRFHTTEDYGDFSLLPTFISTILKNVMSKIIDRPLTPPMYLYLQHLTHHLKRLLCWHNYLSTESTKSLSTRHSKKSTCRSATSSASKK